MMTVGVLALLMLIPLADQSDQLGHDTAQSLGIARGRRERDGVPDRPALARVRVPVPVRSAVPHRAGPQVAGGMGPGRLRPAPGRRRRRDLRRPHQPRAAHPRRHLRGHPRDLAPGQGLHAGGLRRSKVRPEADAMTSMAGRTVLITGGTGGIGRATAEGLAGDGCARHDRRPGRSPARRTRLGTIGAATGARVDVLVADLSDQSEVRRLAAEALDRLPRIDVLVNNVGGYWNTRHADGRRARAHLRGQPPCAVPAHQPAAGSAEETARPPAWSRSRPTRTPRAGSTSTTSRANGRYSGARCLQPVQARQRPVHLRARPETAGQRRHRQRTASRRGEHRVRSRGPRPHPAAGGPAPAALHEATRSEVPPPRSTWRPLRSSRASPAATSPTAGPSARPRAAATRMPPVGCGR